MFFQIMSQYTQGISRSMNDVETIFCFKPDPFLSNFLMKRCLQKLFILQLANITKFLVLYLIRFFFWWETVLLYFIGANYKFLSMKSNFLGRRVAMIYSTMTTTLLYFIGTSHIFFSGALHFPRYRKKSFISPVTTIPFHILQSFVVIFHPTAFYNVTPNFSIAEMMSSSVFWSGVINLSVSRQSFQEIVKNRSFQP